jgi:hypothetical protein
LMTEEPTIPTKRTKNEEDEFFGADNLLNDDEMGLENFLLGSDDPSLMAEFMV